MVDDVVRDRTEWEAPPTEPPLPIFEFEQETHERFRSIDGGLVVLPMQYGFGDPIFEVRHDGEPVLCTRVRMVADAFVCGYDLAAGIVGEALASPPPAQGFGKWLDEKAAARQPSAVEGREADYDEAKECPGHPAGPGDPMGETVYCDGSCVVPVAEGNPRCPSCDRVMSWREHNEQGACNDCNGGAWDGGS